MTYKRITRAYCVELQEVITITQARKEFLAMDPRLEKFHFLCSDKKCRELGVKVTGVLYRENAQESAKHKTAHFREKDKHLPDCEWEGVPEEEDSNGLLRGETEDAARRRKARRKLNDFVDVFDPSEKDSGTVSPKNIPGQDIDGSSGTTSKKEHRTNNGEKSDFPGITKSSDLERLVECFREAKETLTPEEFAELEIVVKGVGRMKLSHYFRRLNYAKTDTNQCVMYGGVKTTVKRYGKGKRDSQGFLLKFYDTVDNRPVSLYVSPTMMQEYRHRKYIDDILSKADSIRYFTVYVLGHFDSSENEFNSLNLTIKNLRQLAIVLGPQRKDSNPID